MMARITLLPCCSLKRMVNRNLKAAVPSVQLSPSASLWQLARTPKGPAGPTQVFVADSVI
jgi:hypothetical protein